MKKALIRETGEILDVKQKYSYFAALKHYKHLYQKMNLTFNLDFVDSLNMSDDDKNNLKKLSTSEEVWVNSITTYKDGEFTIYDDEYNVKSKKEGTYYILSDDNKYFEEELVVGMDNIRDWKLKNII